MLESISYKRGKLEILDQVQLPLKTVYCPIKGVQDGWNAIRTMQVRGAPAIAIVGALSLAIELNSKHFVGKEELHSFVKESLNYLVSARPTAVNMKRAADELIALSSEIMATTVSMKEMKERIIEKAEKMIKDDIGINKQIGKNGALDIVKHFNDRNVSILTHCNTGSLATAGYGTALGVIRSLHTMNRLNCAYFTETRPFLQGARLTAYEMLHDNIPATLICDSMVGYLMCKKEISAVVVGADRVVANGDTANKIGTYQIAVCAKYHGVPFYVAAPYTTIDLSLQDGSEILVEERSSSEITKIQGMQISPPETSCWNPAFDVTPNDLITGGIITENGVFHPNHLKQAFLK